MTPFALLNHYDRIPGSIAILSPWCWKLSMARQARLTLPLPLPISPWAVSCTEDDWERVRPLVSLVILFLGLTYSDGTMSIKFTLLTPASNTTNPICMHVLYLSGTVSRYSFLICWFFLLVTMQLAHARVWSHPRALASFSLSITKHCDVNSGLLITRA